MAIDISINDKPIWVASDYSVSEESTPIDPSDTSGSVGQFSISIPDDADARLLHKKVVSLSDGGQGTTTGTVSGVGGDEVTAQVTVDSRMIALNVTRTAKPYTGLLTSAFRYYVGLVGITSGVVIDPSVVDRTVTFRGWKGVVWDQIKALMAAQRLEVSLVSGNIVLRALRGRIAQNHRDSQAQWTLDGSSTAQSVEINYHSGQQATKLAYPLGGWNPDVQSFQVDAGATVEFDISLDPDDNTPLGASLTSIDQPACVASVDRYYQLSSVYTVAGGDGLPIMPAQWAAGGGSVTAKINDDTRSITITIRGATDPHYAPYTIGMSSGDNTYYSSLRLIGTGVFTERNTLTLTTGRTADEAPTEVGATVDSPFINTYDEAFHAGVWALANWTGPKRTIQVTTAGINRRGEVNSYTYMTMGQFNADPDFAGHTVREFNAAFAGLTMREFNELQFAKVQSDFENQAFGNVAGARVYRDGSWYRIRSVSALTPSSISYSAEADDTFADFNTAYAGMTAGEFNALHSGKSNGEYSARPLIEQAAPLVVIPVNSPAVYPSVTLFPSARLFPGNVT